MKLSVLVRIQILSPIKIFFFILNSGLVGIQITYQLKTSDMAAGKVGEYPSTPLTAAECVDFASYARNVDIAHVNGLKVAAEWLQEARRKVKEDNDNSVHVLSILDSLMIIYQTVKCQCSAEALEVNATIHMISPQWKAGLPQPMCRESPKRVCRKLVNPAPMPEKFSRFNALCRQEPVQLKEEMSSHRTPAHKLRCRYVHQGDPRLLLQPVKLEELNTIRPYIAILHNIVTEGEIDFMKRKSPAEFKRGTVFSDKKQKVSKIKISQTMKLPMKYMKKELFKLRGRLKALTRLNMRSFERIQVANYGTGGFYGFHVDIVEHEHDPEFSSKNNRLVTMVMYLTDVEAGGQTCFPTVGVVAPPKRGNILLFRNLHRNGTGVNESTHTSCPVMVGEKWIAIQWVRVYNQEFHFPCSLDPDK